MARTSRRVTRASLRRALRLGAVDRPGARCRSQGHAAADRGLHRPARPIAAAAILSAGLVVIFIVLEAVGLTGPTVNVIMGSMLAIDRPLDMYRTAVNVFSDSCGAAIIARSERETGVDTEVR